MSTSTLAPTAAAYLRVAHDVAYCRISRDGDGRGLGVERQEEDTRRLASILGLSLSEIIVENDSSASGYSSKPRVLWPALIERVRSGEVGHIVAYSLSRLTRNMIEREHLLELRHLGLTVTTVQGHRIYPGMSAAEVQMIRYMGVNDSGESDAISERTKRAFDQNAAAGTPHGPIAYGWSRHHERDGRVVDTIDPAQADVLREVAARMIEGETTASIVRDLNAREIPAPRGGSWSTTILTKLMLRERNRARRVHRGEVVGPAAWEPLYDDATHAAVVAHLRDPARLKPRAARTHLLSGLLSCGRCGSNRIWVVHGTGTAKPAYQCKECFGIRRVQEPIDLYVSEAMIARLARPDALDWLAQDVGALEAARANVAALRGQLAEAADLFSAGAIDGSQLSRISADLRPQLAAAEAGVELARPLPAEVRGLLGLGSEEATREAWEAKSLAGKRAAIAALLTITVLPTTKRKFAPDQLRLDWLGQA